MKTRNVVILTLLACLSFIYALKITQPVSAAKEHYYNNGIKWYDGDCKNACDDAGVAGLLPGDTNQELVWNGFVKANIPGVSNNPAVLSALIGNCMAESGCEPFTHVSGSDYWGLFQTLTSAIVGPLQERGISTSDPAWGYPAKETTREKKEACIAAQIEALQENSNFIYFVEHIDSVEHKTGEEGARAYAELFTVVYERCVCALAHFGLSGSSAVTNVCSNTANELEDSKVKTVVDDMYGSAPFDLKYRYQAVNVRRDVAQEFFKENAGTTPSTTTATSTTGKNVTVIGDSIGENAKIGDVWGQILPDADLYVKCSKKFGNGTNDSTITSGDFDATGCQDTFSFSPGGRNWSGIHVLKYLMDNNQVRDILVFELGTNGGDGNITKESIAYIMKLTGTRRVVFTTNYAYGSYYPKNAEVVNQAAKDYPGRVFIADWASVVKEDPSLISNDDCHPVWDGDRKGSIRFVETLRDAILEAEGAKLTNCAGVVEATTGNTLADTAKQLSWPEADMQKGINGTGTDAYDEAAKKNGGSFLSGGSPYYSCSRAVSLFILESGADPDFAAKTQTADGGHNHMFSDDLIAYFESSPNWEKVSNYTGNGYDDLAPGDVLYEAAGSHVFMYVGDGYVSEAGDYDTFNVAPVLHKWTDYYDLGQGHAFFNNGNVAYRLKVSATNNASSNKSNNTSSKNNIIADTAIKFAWPEGEDDTQAPNAAYAAALRQYNIASMSTDHNWQIGKSCNAYVQTVMYATGIDDDFKASFDVFLDYVENDPDYIEVKVNEAQPGDIRILVSSQIDHIEIVVADTAGNLKIASASAGNRYGGIHSYYEESEKTIRVFRNTKAGGVIGKTGDTCEKDGKQDGSLKEGGYQSAEEAKAALKSVYDNDDVSDLNIINTPTGDKHDNCVAFSTWFMARYTSLYDPSISNDGALLAHDWYNFFKDKYDITTSDKPIVYSLASWSKSIPGFTDSGNHTGIVVGINGDKVIIAQAGWKVPGGSYFTEHNVSDLSGPGCFYMDITPYLTKKLK